ncbi:MAG: ABC transporter ATP-binding protein [Planctomycetota bacterium]
MSDPEPLPLALRGVAKRFRQGERVVEALAGVDLEVRRGELLAVMGASGSGKSTLLHVVAGLTPPDAGQVLVAGRDVGAQSDVERTLVRRRQLGLVFQAFNLIPALTAEENVTLPLLADGRADLAAQRLEPLLERLGLRERRGHRPDALSGGEQQRVAIARALVTDPALVLADEPTGSLDSVTGQGICRLLDELCREQRRTVVVVTHEPAVAAWAHRVVVLRDGRKLAELARPEAGWSAQELAARYQEAVGLGGAAAQDAAAQDAAAQDAAAQDRAAQDGEAAA